MRKYLLVLLLPWSVSTSAVVTYKCEYPKNVSPEGPSDSKLDREFNLTFVVDEKADHVYMVGMLGTARVQMFKETHGEAITFVEFTPSNTLQVTVIDSKGQSVHSRHSVIHGEVVPSQYYGTCERQD